MKTKNLAEKLDKPIPLSEWNRQHGIVVDPISDKLLTSQLNVVFKRYATEQVELHKAGLIKAMIDKALKGDVFAFNALLDRTQGKPAQAIEHSGTDGNPIVFMPLELIQKHALTIANENVIDGNKDVTLVE